MSITITYGPDRYKNYPKMTILEWSEEQQCFHYNSAGSRATENSNGYRTIGVYVNDKEASYFADFLQVQFIDAGKNLTEKRAIYTLRNLERFILSYRDKIISDYELEQAEYGN